MLKRTISSWRALFVRRFGVPLTLLGLVAGFSPLTATVGAHAGTMQSYIVLYSASAVPADASASIARAGGSLVYSYPQIGVAIAKSDSPSFRANLVKDNRVEGAATTAAFATRLKNNLGADNASGPPPANLPNSPASDADTFSPLQWDMRQIHTPEAHAITGGSPAVLVGDIDTGIDFTHPDLQPNIDVADSVNCLSGAPVAGVAAQDDNGHGTHTAGTIAAAANGIGIVGVAPHVRIAGIKAGNADGYFFPEAVVCAFIWAGTHHVDVTNNSYFADPFLFNCRNDPVQHAIWKAEQRAIRFAQQQGTLVVAAEGNESEDLSHPTADATSPDFPPGTNVTRSVTNACVVIPVEISGVVGVTADGNARQIDGNSNPNDFQKSFYSSYGVSTADVVAPGGDSVFGRTAESFNGRVLSTWPIAVEDNCLESRRVFDPNEPGVMWCYQQGTSMASPHVAGVAALIISQFGKMPQGAVEAYIRQTANPQPCPTAFALGVPIGIPPAPAQYLSFTGTESGAVQKCQGGVSHNSWYGDGQVNALNAVTHTTSSK
jgi:lantibiotic leader peptide-processing serine protease